MRTLEIFFWISLFLFLHPYTTYPLSLIAMKAVGFPWRRRLEKVALDPDQEVEPSVTAVVVAHNEEREIGARIENLLELDYPSEKLGILVISDGSSDGTDAIVASYGDRLRWIRSPDRVGKAACLNLGLEQISDRCVVFTDANTQFDRDVLRRLVAPLVDPAIGFVVGTQGYRTLRDAPAERSESSYSDHETWLKRLESDIGSVVGGDGAIMAMRRELVGTLADDDVSDLRLPLECVYRGYRGVFEPTAKGWEVAPGAFRKQFHRKTRIIHRSIRTMARSMGVLNPFRTGWFAYLAMSHKVLRWFGPLVLIACVLCSLGLWWGGRLEYGWFLIALLGFIGVAAGYGVPGLRRVKLVYLSFYFWMVQCAAFFAIFRLPRGDYYKLWEPVRE